VTGDEGRRGILLVDDNAMDVELTLEAFAEVGLGDLIQVTRSGSEAVSYLLALVEPVTGPRAPLPELILLDLKMPGVDGFEVLRQIKTTPGLRRTPVVVLTSSRERRDLAKAYDLCANSYLVKPIAYAGFLEVVRHIGLYWLQHNVSPPTVDIRPGSAFAHVEPPWSAASPPTETGDSR
jgi:CheY-like chemotaxis protein